jgi:hypothetical protein
MNEAIEREVAKQLESIADSLANLDYTLGQTNKKLTDICDYLSDIDGSITELGEKK